MTAKNSGYYKLGRKEAIDEVLEMLKELERKEIRVSTELLIEEVEKLKDE